MTMNLTYPQSVQSDHLRINTKSLFFSRLPCKPIVKSPYFWKFWSPWLFRLLFWFCHLQHVRHAYPLLFVCNNPWTIPKWILLLKPVPWGQNVCTYFEMIWWVWRKCVYILRLKLFLPACHINTTDKIPIPYPGVFPSSPTLACHYLFMNDMCF